ncbi:MAG TPA: FAD binding domain-containing protein, partial [Burkholderiales bacterium]|nr:FAD binding domain-containing protein [Burkholderiales bacterium]
MTEMRYEAPDTLHKAVALLAAANGQARVLAGGTDLVLQMRSGRVQPALLVDIKRIPEMTAITSDDGAFRFGAAVTGMELLEHAAFAQAWPGVLDGVMLIGSIQVKGRATVGGNVCNASPAADSVPALMAAGAIANILGPGGKRECRVEDVVAGPGKTTLAPGEIITSFTLPRRLPRSSSAYLRFTPRTEMDIAVVG